MIEALVWWAAQPSLTKQEYPQAASCAWAAYAALHPDKGGEGEQTEKEKAATNAGCINGKCPTPANSPTGSVRWRVIR